MPCCVSEPTSKPVQPQGRDSTTRKAGDTFALKAEIAHTERYCPREGATYWVARKAAAHRPKA